MSAKKHKRVYKKRNNSGNTTITVVLLAVLIAVLAVVLFYFFYSARQPEKPPAAKQGAGLSSKPKAISNQKILDGTWVSRADGRLLEIHGNRFTLELPSVSDHTITKGTIQIGGNTAYILYTGTNDLCNTHKGVYTFSIKKGVLHFSVKQDVCAGRKKIFSTTWEKF